MNKTVTFLYPNSFPIGSAATNRVFHIAKAIQESGRKVRIICTRSTENSDRIVNVKRKGTFKGVHFFYAPHNIIWPKSNLGKALNIIKGIIKTTLFLLVNKKRISIVISYANYSFLQNFIFYLSCKLTGKKFVYSVDEYPWSVIDNRKTFYDKFYLLYFYKLFDGFIVMTNTLIEYYKKLGKRNAEFVHIPMTVELERFDIALPNSVDQYIAYCGGDISGTKDGVDILVKAFDLIKDEFPELKLYIIGNVNHSVIELANNLSLDSRVRFLGFCKRNEVPQLLINARALCLARPNNLQAEGGFPTKLGEYLAAGRPVVVTKVGEVINYLEDGITAFLAEPGDVKSFAEKLDYILSNPEVANEVGVRGKELAKIEFDYRANINRLNNFLNSLN